MGTGRPKKLETEPAGVGPWWRRRGLRQGLGSLATLILLAVFQRNQKQVP